MLYFLFHNYASFLNGDESFITEKFAQLDGYVYQGARRCEISARKYEFNQEIRFSFPKLWHASACLGANELWHSVVLSMLLARLTCWLLAMIHATFNVCLRLVPPSQPVCAIRYTIGSTKNEFVLRKIIGVRPFFAYRNDFIIGTHTRTHIPRVMECPIEHLMKYLGYDSSTVIALTQYKSLWKTFLRKHKKTIHSS